MKMPRYLVLCGSMSSYQEMQTMSSSLRDLHINCIMPTRDSEEYDGVLLRGNKKEIAEYKTNVSKKHIRTIRHPSTHAILIINTKKHNIPNYIGPNTLAEIALAFMQNKRIFLLYGYPAVYEDELSAWGIVPLCGDLDPLVNHFKTPYSYQLFLPGFKLYE